MKIVVEQSGGYAGVRTRVADVDTADLDPNTARRIEDAVKSSGILKEALDPSPPLGADLLTYEITITDQGKTQTVKFTDDGRPEHAALLELVNALSAVG